MRKDGQESVSLWPTTMSIPARGPLEQDLATQICIVGAGIAGLTTGYRLVSAGRRVVIVDAGGVGGGETERTTAHLSLVLDDGYVELERLHGVDGMRLAAESHGAAIDEIERIVSREKIDCGFERVDGFLFAPPGGDSGGLARELEASLRAGIQGVELIDRAPLPSFDTGPALRYPRQAQFHPLRYLSALAEAFERLGGRLFCDSRAEEVKGGSPARVQLRGGRVITAEAVIVAANTPFNDRLAIHTKQASYRTYAIAAPVQKGSVPRSLFWDTGDPYHYVRFLPGADGSRDLVIVGGEDHKTGQMEKSPGRRYERLEQWARKRFPGIQEVSHRWSGQVVGTADGLAFIGSNPGDEPNIFIVTGDCGHGMTHGTIAGILLPELIDGKSHAWRALYDPGRVRSGSLKKWASENLNSAKQYLKHLLPGEVASAEEIPPGGGAILRRGLFKSAVYREPDGTLRTMSATCPHLGALVCWNSAEKTWDCPAHGSRFSAGGEVLNGPAKEGLPQAPSSRRSRRRRGAPAHRRRGAAPRGKKEPEKQPQAKLQE